MCPDCGAPIEGEHDCARLGRCAWDYDVVWFLDADGSEQLYVADMGLMQIDEALGRLTLSEVADVWAEIFARPPRATVQIELPPEWGGAS
jgi:hypothetical protein